jgi:hypothetical protein
LEFLELPGYGIRYALKGNLVRNLIFRVPDILRSIRREHAWLGALCRQRRIDAVISDNRYGLYQEGRPCIFITHQLFIRSGLGRMADGLLLRLNRHFIRRFSVCWVPDLKNPFSVAGILSNPPRLPRIPVEYIGILSRFQSLPETGALNPLLVLISGPEPQRSLFEEKLLQELAEHGSRAIVVRGLPGSREPVPFCGEHIKIFNHLDSGSLNKLLCNSDAVICRSGYSTVMDLLRLHKKAILIPTPGQPEQEYLAEYLHAKKWAYRVRQEEFNLKKSMSLFREKEFGFPDIPGKLFPEEVVEALAGRLHSENRSAH